MSNAESPTRIPPPESALEGLYAAHFATVADRYTAALAATGFDGAVIPAGGLRMLFRDDHSYPFKPNPQFRLWVPEPAPDCAVVFEPGKRPVLVFHQAVDYWHAPPELPSAWWARHFDVAVIREPTELPQHVRKGPRWALLGEPCGPAEGLGEPDPAALIAALDWHRAAKTPYELGCLRRASFLGAIAHRAAESAYRTGASEYDAHIAFCQAIRSREEELPYNNIIAYGRHGAVLHYQHLDRVRPASAPSFLIDAGAPCLGYGSDITRTWSAAQDEFAQLVAAVDAAERRLAAQVLPGVDYADIHLAAHREIAAILSGFRIASGSVEALVETGVTRVFFPHGIGHLLGLQVHDVAGLAAGPAGGERPRPPGHPYLRLTRRLEESFVVTIEPGLYFIDPLLEAARGTAAGAAIDWARVDAFRPFGGVRIEDNVVARQGGAENLTRDAFGTLGG
ncbi:MAG: Xaa-Pro dipeptidase [Steroidobacteraceae bacterium]|nr:Xaa-Pro dipeptidase [Steroidobacteraceae bacterium]